MCFTIGRLWCLVVVSGGCWCLRRWAECGLGGFCLLWFVCRRFAFLVIGFRGLVWCGRVLLVGLFEVVVLVF